MGAISSPTSYRSPLTGNNENDFIDMNKSKDSEIDIGGVHNSDAKATFDEEHEDDELTETTLSLSCMQTEDSERRPSLALLQSSVEEEMEKKQKKKERYMSSLPDLADLQCEVSGRRPSVIMLQSEDNEHPDLNTFQETFHNKFIIFPLRRIE